MKIRNGFVSNSSSTCFLVNMTDKDKSLMHYDWLVEDHEYVFMQNKWDEERERELLERGYSLVDEYDKWRTYSATMPILKANADVGRSTSIAFGGELSDMVDAWNDFEWMQREAQELRKAIENYGLENLLFIRESDEGMGGSLPAELNELAKDAILEFEYH